MNITLSGMLWPGIQISSSPPQQLRQTQLCFNHVCRHKQQLLAHNRLSTERIFSIFGKTGQRIPGVTPQDFATLLEFAENGITPIVSPGFQPESINVAPLRDRYLKLHHTIDRLLYKLYKDGTMIFLQTNDALGIDGLHLSPQHHADLSGQHDPNFTPLNGSLTTKTSYERLLLSNGVTSSTLLLINW